MLVLEHITFRYKKELPAVLEDISLSFEEGEFVAITGRNGSGKTTITRILTGLEKPEKGLVVYNGKNVTATDAAYRSHFIGYVFQQPDRQMFMPTVREEIGFGPFQQGKSQEEIDFLVNKAMEETDLTRLADAYPRTLSRGDQQRVAIASALVMNTGYVVLDEPTSGQDGREKKRLLALMERLQRNGITIILVTHDMDIVAKAATRVIVVANKKIAFDGTPAELFSKDQRPEAWGLAYPTAVRLGRSLPGAPYCKDMDTFCRAFLELQAGDRT